MERDVGVLHELAGRVAVIGEARHADARPHLDRQIGHVERRGEDLGDMLRGGARIVAAAPPADDDPELVAAEAREEVVFIDDLADPGR